jgi:long-chain fatty acid transport protein
LNRCAGDDGLPRRARSSRAAWRLFRAQVAQPYILGRTAVSTREPAYLLTRPTADEIIRAALSHTPGAIPSTRRAGLAWFLPTEGLAMILGSFQCTRLFFVTAAFLALASSAGAQSNVEVNGGAQFDFVNPGARSLAMGGAFIGMADDATTAFTNPAGLRFISRKEVSLEVKSRSFETLLASRGRDGGSPSGNGADTVPGLQNTSSVSDVLGVAFASFVFPRPKWAVAVFRHELANYLVSVRTEGFFVTSPSVRRLPITGDLDLSIVGYGAAASYLIIPTLSVGAGVTLYDFSLESTTSRFAVNDQRFTNPPFFGAPNYTSGNRAGSETQFGDGRKAGVNAGISFTPVPQFRLGVVFRQGAEFDVSVQSLDASDVVVRNQQGRFNAPDVFGAGIAVKPVDGLTIAADAVHVRYTQLKRGFVNVFGTDQAPLLDYEPQFYSVNDATELRIGAEYLITKMRIPVALRGGVWVDPEHSMVYSGSVRSEQITFQDYTGDVNHVTFGAGVALRRFELNGGVDLSTRVNTASVSTVVRF